MADRIIQFPARSANQSTKKAEHAQLLKAAKGAYYALLLAVANPQENTIIRLLAEAIAVNDHDPDPPRTPAPAVTHPRCEVALSSGCDATGEHAVECGRIADLECQYCGPICVNCAEETSCFVGAHNIVASFGEAA